MCSRPRDEAGRFLPATNIIPTPTSNPIENSRIARPVDDNFDARLSASVTRTLTPMFDQLMNRLDAMETRIAARYNSTSPARDLSSQPRHLESAYIDRRQHVDAKIQRDPIQHVAPTPEPTSTSAEPSPRRTESSETAAEDVCDISFRDPGTVSGEIVASKLATATTPIPRGDTPVLKIDESQSTSAEPTETPRRTDNSKTATKNIYNVGISDTDKLMSGDIAPSKLAAATPIPKGDITILKIDDDIDGIESSNHRKYDSTDDIAPPSARVDTAYMAKTLQNFDESADNSETAAKDVRLRDIIVHPKANKLDDITPPELAATASVAGGDITISKMYDGIDGIEPSSDRVDIADMSRNALQILGRTSGTPFKLKYTFPCPIAHSDVDWGGSLSPRMDIWRLMVYQVARSGFIRRFMCQLGVS
jgi:hypothetical protein